MRPRNRAFISRIRELAHDELKKRPADWREYKRSRHRGPSPRQWFATAIFFLFLAAVAFRAPHEAVAFSLALCGLGVVLIAGQAAGRLLNRPEPNYLYLHYPIPDRTVFRTHMKGVFGSSMWLMLAVMIGLSSIYRDQLASWRTWGTTASAAALIWLASLGAILMVARWVPTRPNLGLPAMALIGAAFLVPSLPENVVQSLHHVLVLTPAGAMTWFIAEHRFHGHVPWASLLPVAVYIVALPWMYVQLGRSYSSDLYIDQLFADPHPGEAESDESWVPAEQQSLPPVDIEIAAGLVRESLEHTNEPGQRRWLTRLIERQFSARERVVHRFMCGGIDRDWTRNWDRANIGAFIVLLVALPTGIPEWVVWMTGSVVILFALPIFGGSWPGFAEVYASTKLSPFYTAFPVTFREIATVILKVNVTRILAWSPGVVIVFVSVGTGTPLDRLIAAVEFLYGVILFQLSAILFKFSTGSDDSKRLDWKRTPITLAMWPFLIAFAMTWLALFVVHGWWMKLLCAVAMAVVAVIAFGLYRFGYEKGCWDLVKN